MTRRSGSYMCVGVRSFCNYVSQYIYSFLRLALEATSLWLRRELAPKSSPPTSPLSSEPLTGNKRHKLIYVQLDCLLKNDPPFCYRFVQNFVISFTNMHDIPRIFEKFAKNPNDRWRALHSRPLPRRPLHGHYRHLNQTVDQKLGI